MGRAIDISDVANQVYKHNFPDVEVKGSNICGLTPELLLKLQINAIFMSPPCQPFTRQGNQKDISDNRSEPFLHIVQELLPNVNSLNYLLVENVKGFENSKAHEILVKTLGDCGFKYQEFLLCPKQLGMPNSRLRYYLIASKSEHFHQGNQIISDVSSIDTQIIKMFQRTETNLESYILNKDDPFDINQVLVDGKVLEKHAEVLDIVQAESVKSCCFTKSYGKYAEGTGSVLQQSGDLVTAFQDAAKAEDLEERIKILKSLKLRCFTPFEVAKLMGFPDDFDFPSVYVSRPHLCFRVLGNSLNVTVVAMLSTLLIKET